MSVPHIPLGNGANGTAHYERLSRDVLRLDRTISHVNHRRHHHGVAFWVWLAFGVSLILLGAAGLLGWRFP